MFLAFLIAAVLVAAAATAPALDIASSGIVLGSGWYGLETDRGRQFRWVDNDAAFTIEAPTSRLVYLNIAAEGGPGLGSTSVTLRVLDAQGRQVDAVLISAQQEQQLLILPVTAGGSTFRLHVDGGGKRAGKDSRRLNFRVFTLTFPGTRPAPVAVRQPVQSGPDIANNGVLIGYGWYPLEHFKGATFRWVNNDAQLIVEAPKDEHAQLRLSVETGPGMSQRPFELFLRDAGGHAVGSARVGDLTNLYFTVDLRSGKNAFLLHADGGGKSTPHDPRTLNFRVLRITLVA
jgi:hypothetical protein